jgi:acylglycerol lipase
MVSVITVSRTSSAPVFLQASPLAPKLVSNCLSELLSGNAYYDLFPNLATTYTIAVHSFDQRGWGRSVQSPRQKGLTGPTITVLADIRAFCNSFRSVDGSDPPLFLMGHSMGGAEALHFMLTETPRPLADDLPKGTIRGLLLESPYIALHPDSQPSGFTVWAGKLAARIAPSKQMLQKLDSTYMSRDPQVRKDWEEDKLCHDTGTLEGLAGMLQRAAELTALGEGKAVEGLKLDPGCPVWFGHGSGDRVTSYDESKRLFGKLKVEDKTFKNYEGAYHKLHAEPEGVKEEFVKDVGEWILAHIPGQEGEMDVKAKL